MRFEPTDNNQKTDSKSIVSEDAISELVSYLKIFKLPDEDILLIVTCLQVYINDYVEDKFLKTFTDEEIEAIEEVALEEGFNVIQKVQMLEEGYKDKTESSIKVEIDKIIKEFTVALKQGEDYSKKIIEQLKNLPDENDDAGFVKVANQILNQDSNN